MHKIVLVSMALFAVALSAPQQPQPQGQQEVYILKHDSEVHPEGYSFDFETSDGTARQEQGTLKDFGDNHRAIEVNGSYKYVAPDGLTYAVTFIADENGYRPQEHVEHNGQQ